MAKSILLNTKYGYPIFATIICCFSFSLTFGLFGLGLFEAFINLILLMPVFGVFLVTFRSYCISVILASLSAFIIHYIDWYVYSQRLTHIRLSDFSQIDQAIRVADRYSILWDIDNTKTLFFVIILCLIFVFVTVHYHVKQPKKPVVLHGMLSVLVSLVLFFSGAFPKEAESFDFTADTESNGLMYSWYCQYHGKKGIRPEGYSKDLANGILSRHSNAEGHTDVDVIVIMNESLTDYSQIGLTDYSDPLINIHRYDKNYFYGKLAVSVYGGGTANTEYEFLTGNSLSFLPEGAIPYLQYIIDDRDSIAQEMEDLGYITQAIHPYYSEEWNRTQVYNYLGFDSFISGIDFGNTVATNGMRATTVPSQNLISFGDGPLYVRGLISDQSCLERVLEELTDNMFIFTVTMQNHGDYEYVGDDFVNTSYISEDDDSAYSINQYLTCTHLSDAAFKMFTDKLESRARKTIVLMFGDHQPALLRIKNHIQIEQTDKVIYYDVPYILWANYDLEFDAPAYTSPNYLSAILKKNAGLPLTPWDQFRLDMMEKYPVVTTNFILDKKGNHIKAEDMNEYAIVQYMRMFDSDGQGE